MQNLARKSGNLKGTDKKIKHTSIDNICSHRAIPLPILLRWGGGKKIKGATHQRYGDGVVRCEQTLMVDERSRQFQIPNIFHLRLVGTDTHSLAMPPYLQEASALIESFNLAHLFYVSFSYA